MTNNTIKFLTTKEDNGVRLDVLLAKKIKDRIKKGEDIFERGFKIKKIEIDESFPDYIRLNQDMLKNWIA